MLPVKSCGIGTAYHGLGSSQEHGPGQLFRKFNVEAFSFTQAGCKVCASLSRSAT
jgi:hypothetical protein